MTREQFLDNVLSLFETNDTDVLIQVDGVGRYLYLSPNVEILRGFKPDDLIGKSAFDDLHPDDLPVARDLFASGRVSSRLEYRIRHRAGHYVWYEGDVRIVRDASTGAITEMWAISRDIDVRKRRERLLASHRELLEMVRGRLVFQKLVPDILRVLGTGLAWDLAEFWDADADGLRRVSTTWWRDGSDLGAFAERSQFLLEHAACRLPEEALELGRVLVHEEISPNPSCPRAALVREKGFRSDAAFPVRLAGKVAGVFCFFSLESRRLCADAIAFLEGAASLLEQTLVLDRMESQRGIMVAGVEFSGEAIVVTDREGLIRYLNPAAERIYGFSREEAIGRSPRLWKSGLHDVAFYRDMWTSVLAGNVWRGRIFNRRKDDTLIEAETTIAPIQESAGLITGFVAVGRDVSRERDLENRLHQSQKMESIGQLAGGVAHDFNNLLTVILGHAELLLAEMDAAGLGAKRVDQVIAAAERAASLARQLLVFSRRHAFDPKVLRVNAVISGLREMLRRLIGEQIDLRLELGADDVQVLADPHQIEQVVVNLVVNARDALAGGGWIRISTRASEDAADHCRIHASEGNEMRGPHVRIEVADNGTGMTPEVRSRIFEPFFTTKEPGKGTGLGLATVFGVVEQCGGHVHVESAPGSGTTFRICLPLAAGEAAEARGAVEASSIVGGSGSILLAEDEQGVRDLLSNLLTTAGYRVTAAEDGARALALFEPSPSSYDILVTDMVMPGISGRTLASRFREIRPEIPVLIMSGYSSSLPPLQDLKREGYRFIQKPLTGGVLTRAVALALSHGAPGE